MDEWSRIHLAALRTITRDEREQREGEQTMDFLDRCAEADPETAALMMALYNEGVRAKIAQMTGVERQWYDTPWTGGGRTVRR